MLCNDPSIIEVFMLDGSFYYYANDDVRHSGGIALPRSSKRFVDSKIQRFWSGLSDSINSPVVFIGCSKSKDRVTTVAPHELGHILTGRGHHSSSTSIMYTQDSGQSFIEDFAIIGKPPRSSTLSKTRSLQIRTWSLIYGATGNNDFNSDY